MAQREPVILVTNDDGITAPGLRALVDAVKGLGKVIVVSPDSPQSGMGHAITIAHPLRLDKVDVFKGIEAYQCSGTPADCVKLAKDKLLKRDADLCVSGINHGSNSSINVIYSGTMSAAVEAAIEGIPAIGFSLLDHEFNADFTAASYFAKKISEQALQHCMPQGTLLNVNIPRLGLKSIKGIKVCRQARAKWEENYDKRLDPRGREYFWMKGRFIVEDQGEDTDEWALMNGYVSIVPTQFDLTAHHAISLINNNWTLNAKTK